MSRAFRGAVAALCLAGAALTARGELVDNPAYASWAACKLGTTVIHEQRMPISKILLEVKGK